MSPLDGVEVTGGSSEGGGREGADLDLDLSAPEPDLTGSLSELWALADPWRSSSSRWSICSLDSTLPSLRAV